MNKNQNHHHRISDELFLLAFSKLYNCKPDELEFRVRIPGGSILIAYKEELFRVDTYAQLFQDAKDDLENEDGAVHISPHMWVQITGDEYKSADFYAEMLNGLTERENLLTINTAINVANIVVDKKKGFWTTLNQVDCTGDVYPKAIVVAAKLQNIDKLAENLVDIRIRNGEQHYNIFVGGIFEPVVVDIKGESLTFYVYSQDWHAWDIIDNL